MVPSLKFSLLCFIYHYHFWVNFLSWRCHYIFNWVWKSLWYISQFLKYKKAIRLRLWYDPIEKCKSNYRRVDINTFVVDSSLKSSIYVKIDKEVKLWNITLCFDSFLNFKFSCIYGIHWHLEVHIYVEKRFNKNTEIKGKFINTELKDKCIKWNPEVVHKN